MMPAEAMALFDVLDSDGDGALSPDEFGKHAWEVSVRLPLPRPNRQPIRWDANRQPLFLVATTAATTAATPATAATTTAVAPTGPTTMSPHPTRRAWAST